jgi:enamine deaminase RidA (YjgF/YER057c/UK114 family)
MSQEIEESTFPELSYLLSGYLIDQTETIEESLKGYLTANGAAQARQALAEMAALLASSYSDEDVTKYVENNSIFLDDDGGRATIRYIYDVLSSLID